MKLLVITETEQIFNFYFNPHIFKRLRSSIMQNIRGLEKTVLILYGRYWLYEYYYNIEKELINYCHNHEITIIHIKEN